MRITVNIEDDLISEAKELTKINHTQDLIRYAVERMKEYEALRELVKLGGTEPDLRLAPRRRPVVVD